MKNKKRKHLKSFNQFLKPSFPNYPPMGISYFDNDQDCFMNGVIEEDEEIFKKGEICTCGGNGCSECNGIGFKRLDSNEELD